QRQLRGHRARLSALGLRALHLPARRHMISFRNLVKSFGGKPVLRGVTLEVQRGEVLFIIGTSGVGKAVTIKHLVGLLRAHEGQIWLDDQRVDSLDERALYDVRKKCAMVFQHATLLDSM